MELIERLSALVGHGVRINTYARIGNNNTNEGILEEIGVDYLVIKTVTPWDQIDETSESEGQWFVKVKDIDSIQHVQNCIKCINK